MEKGNTHQMLEGMLTLRQVADFMKVNKQSVRRWSKSGELRAYKLGNAGLWRYWPDDVAHFMEQQNGVKL